MRIRCMLNVLGKPKEFVKEVMEKKLGKIKEERKVYSSQLLEPKRVGKSFYSVLMEVETEARDFTDLISFILDYVPVNIEILEEENLNFEVADFQSGMNDLITRIQEYEEGIKAFSASTKILSDRLRQILQQKNDKNKKRKKREKRPNAG